MNSCTTAKQIYCTNTVHVQLHNSTAHVLHKYCNILHLQPNCTFSNYTQLLLHVQLYNSTAYLLHKLCTNSTVYSWTVLSVITHSYYHMFSCTTAQHIYCTNTVHTVQSTAELYFQSLFTAAATCSAAQQYSTFTVQTVQSTTKLSQQ
jgi:hypothetical protein